MQLVSDDRSSEGRPELVLLELRFRLGAVAAARRLAALDDIAILEVTEDASRLAEAFIEQHALPAKAAVDAIHIAVAEVMGVDYVLTWNCTHIANAVIRPKIEHACRQLGYEPPVICTPEELME